MAGRFISVLGVRTWLDFISAVEKVITSADVVHLDDVTGPVPIAVLVQPELTAHTGGVMFGVDPVSGRRDRLVVSAVAGGPDRLVSGTVDGTQYTLSRGGRKIQGPSRGEAKLLGMRRRLQLVKLADEAQRTFGSPQDMEWAFDEDGKLWLFQSRPVTAVATEAASKGPLLGPGPVAETFPGQLSALEEDLWLSPLRAAIQTALSLTGTASRKRITSSPVVTTVNGWAVADLELLGATTRKKTLWQRIDPRAPSRRLAASWRVGRLRAALPSIANDLVRRTDNELARVPNVRRPSSEELLRIMRRSHQVLVSLHGHEVLAGLISDEGSSASSAGLAMQLLASGRAAGLTDEEITATHPEVLALVPPSIGAPAELPLTPEVTGDAGTLRLGPREALRLRIRWVHELTALIAYELGWRLACSGYLTKPEELKHLSLEELERVVRLGDYSFERTAQPREVSPPPPSVFRLAPDGTPVPQKSRSKRSSARGAGGGRGAGPAHLGNDPKPGDVLVVKVLDPSFATLLPGLGGLVSETGSVLSHLAILAREYGVPTVVGVSGAMERFTEGTRIVVDGATGEVGPVTT
jgi:pyruvate,water dikinase